MRRFQINYETQLNVWFPEAEYNKLKEIAKERGVSISYLVREALRNKYNLTP